MHPMQNHVAATAAPEVVMSAGVDAAAMMAPLQALEMSRYVSLRLLPRLAVTHSFATAFTTR